MDSRHQEMLSKIRDGAVRAFGEDSAQHWMSRKWRVFDDRSPVEMAGRSDAQRVLDYVSQLTAAEDSLKRAGVRENDH